MSKVVLQANFDIDFSRNEDQEATIKRAHALEDLPGLIWKVWIRDRTTNTGGGIYLFEDRASAQAWADSSFPTFKAEWFSNIRYHIFDIDETFSAITGAKLGPVLSQVAKEHT